MRTRICSRNCYERSCIFYLRKLYLPLTMEAWGIYRDLRVQLTLDPTTPHYEEHEVREISLLLDHLGYIFPFLDNVIRLHLRDKWGRSWVRDSNIIGWLATRSWETCYFRRPRPLWETSSFSVLSWVLTQSILFHRPFLI